MAVFNSYLSRLPLNRNFKPQFILNSKFQTYEYLNNNFKTNSLENSNNYMNMNSLSNFNSNNFPLNKEYEKSKFDKNKNISKYPKSKRNFYKKMLQISDILYNNSYSFLQIKENNNPEFNNGLYMNTLKTTLNFKKSYNRNEKRKIIEDKIPQAPILKTKIHGLQSKIDAIRAQNLNINYAFNKPIEKLIDTNKNALLTKPDIFNKKFSNDLNEKIHKKLILSEMLIKYSNFTKNKLKGKYFQKWENNFKMIKSKTTQIFIFLNESAKIIQKFYRKYLYRKRDKLKDSAGYLFTKLKAVHQGWKIRKILNSYDLIMKKDEIIKISEQIKNENNNCNYLKNLMKLRKNKVNELIKSISQKMKQSINFLQLQKNSEKNKPKLAKTFNICKTIDLNIPIKENKIIDSYSPTLKFQREMINTTPTSFSARMNSPGKLYAKKSTQTIPYHLSKFFHTPPTHTKLNNLLFTNLSPSNQKDNFYNIFKSENIKEKTNVKQCTKKDNKNIETKNKPLFRIPFLKSSIQKIKKKDCKNSMGKRIIGKGKPILDNKQELIFDNSIVIKRRKIVDLFYSTKIDYEKYVNISDKRMIDLKKKYQELEALNRNLNDCFHKKLSY